MKTQLLVVATAVAATLTAAVKPGESLIGNGLLKQGVEAAPLFWANEASTRLSWSADGGPNGLPSAKITGRGTLRQYGLIVVPGETYRISGMVRTKDASGTELVVCNHRWFNSGGIKKIPANQDWTRMSAEFVMPESTAGHFVLFGNNKGEAELADVKLEAVSEGALAGSRLPLPVERSRKPVLVPWQVRLHRVPSCTGQIPFRCFGELPEEVANYVIEWKVDDAAAQRQPLKSEINTIKLRNVAKGDHRLAMAITHKDGGAAVFSDNFDITIVDIPKVSTTGHRRLNNFVTEILNVNLKAADTAQTFEFCNPREGWVFIAARDGADGAEVAVDGETVIGAQSVLHGEAFRELPMGAHKVTVKGAAKGGRLIVRSVVDIFNYCPGTNNPVPENGEYGWDVLTKHVLPCVTTLNGGRIPGNRYDVIRANGYRWLGNVLPFLKEGHETEDAMVVRLNACPGLTQPQYDGVTLDEFYFGNPEKHIRFFDNLHRINIPEGKMLYSWIIRTPVLPSVDHWFIAKAINASHGKGKLLSELYCDTKPTEEEWNKFLQQKIVDTVKSFKSFYPGIEESLGVVVTPCGRQMPAVDYKYCLDTQLHLAANAPELDGIGCAGYWGSYYADRELHIWAFKLLRHYCVEGRTDMLSAQYGLRFAPGHIVNNDFADGLEGWTANGDVRTGSHKRLGEVYALRFKQNGAGDTFAVLRKTADEVSSVSQPVKGLVPGRMYCLQFRAIDLGEVKLNEKDQNAKIKPRRYGVDARLGDGVKVSENLSWTNYANTRSKKLRMNLHHIVFTATKPETTLTIDNAAAKPGEEIAINTVSVHSYLPEE